MWHTVPACICLTLPELWSPAGVEQVLLQVLPSTSSPRLPAAHGRLLLSHMDPKTFEHVNAHERRRVITFGL